MQPTQVARYDLENMEVSPPSTSASPLPSESAAPLTEALPKVIATEDVDRGAREVLEILKGRNLTGESLPDLNSVPTTEHTPGLIEKLVSWFKNLFPNAKSPVGTEDLMAWIPPLGIFLLLIGLVLFAVWMSRILARSPKDSRTLLNPKGQFPLDPDQRLVNEIKEAIRDENWARATRLRWRLHLLRRKLSADGTPKEILPSLTETSKFYEAMFRSLAPTKMDYENCAAEMRRLEPAPESVP